MDVLSDVASITQAFVQDSIDKKKPFTDEFRETVVSYIDVLVILFYTLDRDVDVGQLLNIFTTSLFIVDRHRHKKRRLNANREARLDAYCDPVIANYMEIATRGRKTRNAFYLTS
jgi:hypothetical protein